jgi:hypothetical protein
VVNPNLTYEYFRYRTDSYPVVYRKRIRSFIDTKDGTLQQGDPGSVFEIWRISSKAIRTNAA